MKEQKTPKSQTNSKKKAADTTICDLRLYYRVIVINSKMVQTKKTDRWANTTKDPFMHRYSHPYWKKSLFNKFCWTTEFLVSFGNTTKNSIDGSHGNFIFHFLRNCSSHFTGAEQIYGTTSNILSVLFPTLSPAFGVTVLLIKLDLYLLVHKKWIKNGSRP